MYPSETSCMNPAFGGFVKLLLSREDFGFHMGLAYSSIFVNAGCQCGALWYVKLSELVFIHNSCTVGDEYHRVLGYCHTCNFSLGLSDSPQVNKLIPKIDIWHFTSTYRFVGILLLCKNDMKTSCPNSIFTNVLCTSCGIWQIFSASRSLANFVIIKIIPFFDNLDTAKWDLLGNRLCYAMVISINVSLPLTLQEQIANLNLSVTEKKFLVFLVHTMWKFISNIL